MKPLPAPDLRANLATWAVSPGDVPAVAHAMLAELKPEPFDPEFRGQLLTTTYFDTASFALRKARVRGERYLTLRIRCYQQHGKPEAYSVSAKTESQKFRKELPPAAADAYLGPFAIGQSIAYELPADLLARLIEIIGDQPLQPVVAVEAVRFATENATDRLTLDLGVESDIGKALRFSVLEFKGKPGDSAPGLLVSLGLRPIKLSKFLWATEI